MLESNQDMDLGIFAVPYVIHESDLGTDIILIADVAVEIDLEGMFLQRIYGIGLLECGPTENKLWNRKREDKKERAEILHT